jgi:uncharacterized protein (TIGR02569 family)
LGDSTVAAPAAPPPEVLLAFGATETQLHRLTGGRGGAWLAGDVVLKRASGPVHDWVSSILAEVEPRGFRLAPALRAPNGGWSVDGWAAWRRVEGAVPPRPTASTWVEMVTTARAFHEALEHLDRPACLAARVDPWAVADRIAWRERRLAWPEGLAPTVARLEGALAPLGPPQVVHGDLTTNVLFADDLPPAVIDISPYWRPTAYAEGVVVADALCWHGASVEVVARTGVPVPAVARALLFRLATAVERAATAAGPLDLAAEATAAAHAADALGL